MSKTTTISKTAKTLKPLRLMTDDEVATVALSDPDGQPLTPEDFERMRRVPRAKIIRRALGLTHENLHSFRHPDNRPT
jgi:putative transcriptional regulator